jgi:hypothetical protein
MKPDFEQEYVPSAWETDWLNHATDYQNDVCTNMLKDTESVEHWMDTAAEYNETGPTQATLNSFKYTVFSKFVYRYERSSLAGVKSC